jgi:hypothetical protein
MGVSYAPIDFHLSLRGIASPRLSPSSFLFPRQVKFYSKITYPLTPLLGDPLSGINSVSTGCPSTLKKMQAEALLFASGNIGGVALFQSDLYLKKWTPN